MAQKRPKVEPPHKINGSTLGLFWALFGIILGSFMVPLSHHRKLVAQLMAFFEYFLSYFEPFEPPIKVDGSTLGLFWVLFGIILGSFMVPLSHQRKLVAQPMVFFEYFLSYF